MEFSDVQPGGTWKPMTCIARQRTAIIIPYRGRKIHLHTLLHYLIPVLMRQLLDFRIFVTEQVRIYIFRYNFLFQDIFDIQRCCKMQSALSS